MAIRAAATASQCPSSRDRRPAAVARPVAAADPAAPGGRAPDRSGWPDVTRCSAAQEQHPEWMPVLMQFFGMQVLPAALGPLRDEVRRMVRQGWQPAPPDGLTRNELAAMVRRNLTPAIPA